MVEIWQELVNIFNAEDKCGLCYEFVGAGRPDYFNNLKPRVNANGDCCVYVGLLRFGGRKDFLTVNTDTFTGVKSNFTDLQFEVVLGIPSALDLQFYNENPAIDTATSKYIKYIKPLIDCFGDSFELPCDTVFAGLEVSEWKWDLLMNYQDLNLDGIKITGAFRRWHF